MTEQRSPNRHDRGPVQARASIRDAGQLRARTPDSGLLAHELDACRQRADDFRKVGVLGPSALTQAELRILRLLPTHLSYHEIGQQIQRSQYTVKSQALAAFGKLHVSSRSEAVQRARSLGLIRDDERISPIRMPAGGHARLMGVGFPSPAREDLTDRKRTC